MNTRVLIVDDSLTVRMDLVEAFEAAGESPVPCSSLKEARDALAREPFAVIILDVLLPDGDGVEFLKELRGLPTTAGIPVMLLSTEAEVGDRIRGLRTGADEYVGKPYEASVVVARAQELLQRNQPATEARDVTILVIDDSASFRQALKDALETASYRVITAATGEDGLRMAAHERPTAVIVDGVLPGIDGATVVRRIRLDAALRRTPCLLLTASEDLNAEVLALDAGADGFVRKEEDTPVVLARLGAILRSVETAATDERPPSLLSPKKILTVDDSPTYLNELADTLREQGYEVVLAYSGEGALELLAVQRVDCILLDLLMPGLGGHETCRRVKGAAATRDIPVIMLTALEDRTAMLEGLQAGADDYIAKSSDFEVLKARVRAQIRRKQLEDETRRIRERLLHKELEATEARAARLLAETRAAFLEDLERKNKELEAFSYSVSHDLRAPLRSIDGFSQALLEDHSDRLDAKGQDYLRRVRAAAQRMGELIDDLLELSRIGRAEMHRGRVDLSAMARTVAAELQKQDPERQPRFVIPPELVADGDAHLLRVVFDNLLGNAWKFTGKVADARIELGSLQEDHEIAYFVKDNGAGFDMAYMDKLFAPFQRLHSAADFPGTGIGLATVHRIIDRHGGRVWATGRVGEGATVFWTLPSDKRGGPMS